MKKEMEDFDDTINQFLNHLTAASKFRTDPDFKTPGSQVRESYDEECEQAKTCLLKLLPPF